MASTKSRQSPRTTPVPKPRAKAKKPARRVFSISFPQEMAERVEKAAKAENQTISEYFREVVRQRNRQAFQTALEEAFRYGDSLPKVDATEADVERWVDEARQEMFQERMAKK